MVSHWGPLRVACVLAALATAAAGSRSLTSAHRPHTRHRAHGPALFTPIGVEEALAPPGGPDCPAGAWTSLGRISVTDAPCSAKGVDASVDDSDAVERCAQIAANCSIALYFPPGKYWLGRTLALSTATLHSRDGAIALTGDSWGRAELCGCSGCNDRGTCSAGPVLQFGQRNGGGCCSSVRHLDVLGLHSAVHVLNHPGVRMSQAALSSMNAAVDEAPLVITNGFEYYFQDCTFTGAGRGPDHPAVVLRGANASSYNGTYARTPYVYMVSFDRSEFVMGGVLYEQTAQLDNVGAVFFSFCE